MSGIAAMLNLDGKPLERPRLERMSQAMAHRGLDREGLWVSGPIGLAHRLLAITPESHAEQQPLADAGGRHVLIWDGRLDNRAELLKELDGSTDPELALAAYRRWGEDCVRRFVGEFAFVVWDSVTHSLFGARDVMGLRPFHYCLTHATLLISSEIKPILAVLDTRPPPEEAMILAFLLREFRESDQPRTFFQGIHRLPPGSSLRVHDGRLAVRRYWSWDPRRSIRYARREEYAEHFRTLFTEVVASHLRSAGRVACFVSGGMDSSAIACTAARQTAAPLLAVTQFNGHPESDERTFASQVADAAGMRTLEFFHERLEDPLGTAETSLWRLESPLAGADGLNVRRLMELLQAHEVRVALSGIGGDQLIDEDGYLTDVLKRRPWTFWSESRAFARWYGTSQREVLELAISGLLTPPAKYWGKRLLRRAPPPWVNRAFARRAGLEERLRTDRFEGRFTSCSQAYSAILTRGAYQVLLREADEKTPPRYRFEFRYPFVDRRLLEFVLAIPWDRRTRQGERKWLLRRAMAGLVPEAIRARRGKGDMTAFADEAMLTLCQGHPPPVLENRSGMLERYVNLHAARKLATAFLSGSHEWRLELCSIVMLDRWLDLFWNTPTQALIAEPSGRR